jgi:hypothetical protein
LGFVVSEAALGPRGWKRISRRQREQNFASQSSCAVRQFYRKCILLASRHRFTFGRMIDPQFRAGNRQDRKLFPKSSILVDIRRCRTTTGWRCAKRPARCSRSRTVQPVQNTYRYVGISWLRSAAGRDMEGAVRRIVEISEVGKPSQGITSVYPTIHSEWIGIS